MARGRPRCCRWRHGRGALASRTHPHVACTRRRHHHGPTGVRRRRRQQQQRLRREDTPRRRRRFHLPFTSNITSTGSITSTSSSSRRLLPHLRLVGLSPRLWSAFGCWRLARRTPSSPMHQRSTRVPKVRRLQQQRRKVRPARQHQRQQQHPAARCTRRRKPKLMLRRWPRIHSPTATGPR